MIVPVRLRSLRPSALVAAVALAALLAPAPAAGQAPPTLANVYATDFAFTTDGGRPADVTIAAGGHVNFTYFMGNSLHNVVFPRARPTVCGISEGPAGTTAALPSVPSPPGWEGGCDFDVAGTYAFVCGVHPQMTGSVTAVQTAASPPPPPADVELPGGLDGDAAAGDLQVALRQRGYGIRGSVFVARGNARLLARAFARRKSLYAGSRSTLAVQIGRHVRSTGGGVRIAFTAPLNRAARAALRRNGRLLTTLRLTITPREGDPYTATRRVILRSPSASAPRRSSRR